VPHLLALALTSALAACPPLDPPDLATTKLGPIAIGSHLVLGDRNEPALVILDVDDGQFVGLRRIPLETAPSAIHALPGNTDQAATAVVVSAENRTVELIDVDDATAPAKKTLGLSAPFEGLALSPDGLRAIAYHPPGTASSVFHNTDEVALLDLSAAATADDAVVSRTLASLGGAPLSVHLSPEVGGRRWAFVLSEEHVAVVSLDNPDVAERSVPLVSLTSGGARTPTGVEFAVDAAAQTLWAIVATREASSIYALAVSPGTSTAVGESDFDVRLSQIPGVGPGGASTLVALSEGTTSGLFTLTTQPATGLVTLTDVATATGQSLSVQVGVNRIVLFPGPEGAPQALVWNASTGLSFHVIDLVRMWKGQNRAFKSRATRDRFSGLTPIPGTSRFIALHADSDRGLSIIDADSDRVTGFGRTGTVSALELSTDLNRLFVLTRLGSQSYLVSVDLDTLHSEPAPIPDGADGLVILPEVTTVAAVAYRPYGQVALWPAALTTPDTTTQLLGFLADGLFDRTR
jgi:hypothetical protein